MAFIIKPLVTEKMTKITDKQPNRYGFVVRPEANKLEIKKEVESLYNVTVVDVNTIRYAGKRSARYTKAGLVKGQKNAFKKAIVTLKEGDTIDFTAIFKIKMAVRKLNRLLRVKDTKLLARSRILLHPCQRSLSFTVNVLPAVETTPVR